MSNSNSNSISIVNSVFATTVPYNIILSLESPEPQTVNLDGTPVSVLPYLKTDALVDALQEYIDVVVADKYFISEILSEIAFWPIVLRHYTNIDIPDALPHTLKLVRDFIIEHPEFVADLQQIISEEQLTMFKEMARNTMHNIIMYRQSLLGWAEENRAMADSTGAEITRVSEELNELLKNPQLRATLSDLDIEMPVLKS